MTTKLLPGLHFVIMKRIDIGLENYSSREIIQSMKSVLESSSHNMRAQKGLLLELETSLFTTI